MRVKRGFFQIWVVASTLWILLTLLMWSTEITQLFKPPQAKPIALGPPNPEDSQWEPLVRPPSERHFDWGTFSTDLASFPLATMMIWFVGSWIIAGFRGVEPLPPTGSQSVKRVENNSNTESHKKS